MATNNAVTAPDEERIERIAERVFVRCALNDAYWSDIAKDSFIAAEEFERALAARRAERRALRRPLPEPTSGRP